MLFKRSLLALIVCLAAFQVMAADWPQWRGPNRDGLSTEKGLLQQWPKDGPKLLWSASGLGSGYSSIVVAGDKIFTMGDRDKKMWLIALNRADGNELWAAEVGKPWSDGPRCTPTVHDGLVYAIGPHGDLLCAEAANGKEVWRKNLGKDFNGKMMSGWGFSESPLVDGDKLLCTPGGKDATLVALERKTGELIWKCPVPGGDGAAYSSIVISNGAGVKQYVQLLGKGIVGVGADGKFLWRYDRVCNGTANIPTPIIRGDHVFCSTGYGKGAALLKLTKDSSGSVKAEEVYFIAAKDFQNHHGGMILIGDHVYAGSGHNAGAPACVELMTGKLAWPQERGPGTGSAAICFADGHLYFRYQNGVMALIEANPKEYKLKGSFKIPDQRRPSWPHPVVLDGKLYLREQDKLLCYDVKK
ncbi:MAG: PQQ-binding-like beta-propeller repeat protein [Gemmataceae bacterium]